MLTEEQAIDLASKPHLIADSLTCNICIGFLNGYITDMALAEFELELASSQHLVDLLHTEGKTNKIAESEWKVSEPYKEWRRLKLQLQKYRSYRNTLRKKEETLANAEKFNRGSYSRVIE